MKDFYVVKFIMETFKQDLYTKSGILLAKEFVRVVHGKRGDYVEFIKDQIIPLLHDKFNPLPDEVLIQMGHYYAWLYPEGDQFCKVYKQVRTVTYADYKIGFYYVSPDSFIDFKDPEKLF